MTSTIGSLPPLLPPDGPWKTAPKAASFAEREFQVSITTRLIEDQKNYWVGAAHVIQHAGENFSYQERKHQPS